MKKNQNEIYREVQNWVTKTFGNYENAVTKEESNSGKLFINSYLPVRHSRFDHVRFELTIECKDSLYSARIDKLDGISSLLAPVRLSSGDNNLIHTQEVAIKTETSRKKRLLLENRLQLAHEDLDNINSVMYGLLAKLKVYMASGEGN